MFFDFEKMTIKKDKIDSKMTISIMNQRLYKM